MLWIPFVTPLLLSLFIHSEAELSCKDVKNSLRHLQQPKLLRKDFITKPILGQTVDYCNKLEITCCSRDLEQKLSLEANRNFKQDLGYYITQESEFCGNLKVQLAHAVQEAINNSIVILIQSSNIGEANDLLSLLYNYLLHFSETEDVCKLPEIVDKQLQRIAQHILQYKSDSRCLQMVVQPYYATFKRNILELLEPLLGNLKFIIHGTKYKNRLTEFMASYRASPHCVKQLMGMTFCSTCRGLTSQPCHSLCLNTIQGCLVDMADVYWSIKDMLKMLNRVAVQLNLNKINTQMEEVGIHLKQYTLELKKQSVTIKQKLKKNSCLLLDSRRSVPSDNVIPSVPYTKGISIHQKLMKSIHDELKCFNDQLARINSIPEQMCTRRYLTLRSNIGCWTGSSYGTYTAPVADFSREAVLDNENIEYINSSLPNVHELNVDIIQFTQRLDAIINKYVMCHNADDEDCTPFPYITGSNCKILDEIEFSGSGEIVSEILEPNRENSVTIKVPIGATSRNFPTLPPIKLPDNVTNFVNIHNSSLNSSNETIAYNSGAYTNSINAHLLPLVAIMILLMICIA